jgi:steroid delta-isomerase-like uncharacterized protein
MTPQQQVVRRLIDEALNAKDYSVLPELLHDDYVYRTPGEELVGAGALEALFTMYHTAFPDLALQIDDMFGDGDRVATAFTLSGTNEGEMMGMPATGRRVSVHGIIHSRVVHGRITEEWELVDMASLVRQLEGRAD